VGFLDSLSQFLLGGPALPTDMIENLVNTKQNKKYIHLNKRTANNSALHRTTVAALSALPESDVACDVAETL